MKECFQIPTRVNEDIPLIFYLTMKINRICVFCASSSQVDPAYKEIATKTGQIFAKNGITTVYGGGSVGLMGALADAVLEEKGTIIGVIPEFMMELEWGNENVSELLVVEDMYERKRHLIQDTDAILVLPGGIGTLDELTEVLALKQLGRYTNPIIIINHDGFFDFFINQLHLTIRKKFMHPDILKTFKTVQSPGEILSAIKEAHLWGKENIRSAAM